MRLCYAAHAAEHAFSTNFFTSLGCEGELEGLVGEPQTFLDTRLPFFMDSAANQQLSDEVHRPAAPFAFFPYLNVRDSEGNVQMLSGDGVIEGFVARRLGLAGQGALEVRL